MGLRQLNFEGENKIEQSIRLIQAYEPENGYYLGFSGGKDSTVLKALADMAKVKYTAYYHPSPLDPPEQIRFVREFHQDVVFEKPPISFWKAFDKKTFPLRTKRWCCEYIKEWGGADRVCLLGLRSEESRGRKKRCFVGEQTHKTRWGKPFLIISPILLWTTKDVWEFIKEKKLPYCSLYDEGFERLGCVMCPLADPTQRLKEYHRFPKIANAWYKGFQRIYISKYDKYSLRWNSADELFWWWMGDGKSKENENQKVMELNI